MCNIMYTSTEISITTELIKKLIHFVFNMFIHLKDLVTTMYGTVIVPILVFFICTLLFIRMIFSVLPNFYMNSFFFQPHSFLLNSQQSLATPTPSLAISMPIPTSNHLYTSVSVSARCLHCTTTTSPFNPQLIDWLKFLSISTTKT